MVLPARALLVAGFLDTERARRFLDAPELAGLDPAEVVAGCGLSADPDQALVCLVRLLERAPQARELLADAGRSVALYRLLGASEALADFLTRHPESLEAVRAPSGEGFVGVPAAELRARLLRAVGADPEAATPVAADPGPDDAAGTAVRAAAMGRPAARGRLVGKTVAPGAASELRVAYRAALVDLAVRDVTAADPVEAVEGVAAELADLAAAAVEAGLAIARREVAAAHPELDVSAVRLAVIGMGKCGARELNYISDVDVIYVHELAGEASAPLDEQSAAAIAAELARETTRAVSAPGREQALWELDANLRPEGKDGALSRTLDSHASYYKRWAHDWEFQALLKARAIAGDPELGRRYEAMVSPLVWGASERQGFVESVQQMRGRVTENIPPAEVERQIKLGPGGLRDVEFTVQLLQLVHGRVDESLRVRGTLVALRALAEAAYTSREDGRAFGRDYRFLRLMEHRIQLVRMRRTHLMPSREEERRALGRGVRAPLEVSRGGAEELAAEWRRTKLRVRGLHEKIFFRPLLATAASLGDDEVRLSPEAAQARLAALGYLDPRQAMRHIEALTSGVSRTAALHRQLLPVMLGWFAAGVDPDAGLLGFRRLSDSLGGSHWFMAMLRDSPAGAERLALMLATSRMVTDLLEVSPEATAWLGDDRELVPRPWEKLWGEVSSKLDRHRRDPEAGMRLVRVARRREQLRIALADGAGLLDVEGVCHALSDVDQAAVIGALRVAEQQEFAETERLTRFLVVAMGRQGGREIGYGSDADVLFVHDPLDGADAAAAQGQAERLATAIGTLLQKPLKPAVMAERRLQLDADLRPEGRQGVLVRSLASYSEYYARWAEVWERQALLRARPMAGDDDLAAAFVRTIDHVRYGRGASDKELLEVRRIKARVEGERLPRGAEPARHVKLGPGGLSDVEWLVQAMQLRYANEYPSLRVTGTLPALRALHQEGLIEASEAEALQEAWLLATDLRSATVACTGRASDSLPSNRQELRSVAQWTGYGKDQANEVENDWMRAARHARSVFEGRFYPGGA